MTQPSRPRHPSYPPENVENLRLVLRGDNYIYYRGARIAKVSYRPGRESKWYATALMGTFAGRHTKDLGSKVEVLRAVWGHEWLDTLF